MTTVQFTRFRVAADRETAVLRARQESLRPCWTADPPLRAAYLVRLGDDEWLDIAVWAGQDCGEPADAALPSARLQFFAQLDELVGEECGVIESEDLPPEQSASGMNCVFGGLA